jgi:flagellar basal-body rod protein FlgF
MALVGGRTPAIDVQAGAVTTTGAPLDLALDGDGYFAVDTPGGVRYTRAGAFTRDVDGTLRTQTGLAVRSADGGPLQIPVEATQVTVGFDGSIATELGPVGNLALVSFAPGALRHDGNSTFVATGAPTAGPPPRVTQGALEGSNVNVVRGVVDLVKVSRTYESLLRLIQGFHDVESRLARELGGPK